MRQSSSRPRLWCSGLTVRKDGKWRLFDDVGGKVVLPEFLTIEGQNDETAGLVGRTVNLTRPGPLVPSHHDVGGLVLLDGGTKTYAVPGRDVLLFDALSDGDFGVRGASILAFGGENDLDAAAVGGTLRVAAELAVKDALGTWIFGRTSQERKGQNHGQ